jgi:hypothetical protein
MKVIEMGIAFGCYGEKSNDHRTKVENLNEGDK